MASSCIEEIAAPQPETGSELTTLVPRVKSFTNQYVTKAYGDREDDIFSISALVFGVDGTLVHLQESDGEALTLNKSMLNTLTSAENLQSATVVMFANISLSDIVDSDGVSIEENRSSLTLEGLDDYFCCLSNPVITTIPDNFGFPMMGVTTGVNLTSTASQQDAVEVALKILYAKVNFEINVENGTENQDLTSGDIAFTLNSYKVNNASQETILGVPEGNTVSEEYFSSDVIETEGTATLSGSTAKFTFYVAENRYTHNASLSSIYPDAEWLSTTQYDHLKQQYKPAIADASTADGTPTYVVINGSYKDYRGTDWTVNYSIYLGKDNHANFEVDRNSEYTNYLTIKGLRNNDSYGEDGFWIDHRVNVEGSGTAADYVTVTRETLIDSNIEVRPLRVSWYEDDESSEFDYVKIYLPVDNETNELLSWVGIEKFTGDNCQDGATYCFVNSSNNSISTGKRKYFTTGLINELQTMKGDFGVKTDANGRKYLDMYNGHCAWIYFDENTTSLDREATIKLDFYVGDEVAASESYLIKQRTLQTIGDYVVESYEEYLHSYDSADKYNLFTSPVDYTQQGLAWGLANEKISDDIIVTTIANLGDWTPQRYDYFHSADGNGSSYYTYTKNAEGEFSYLRDNPTNFGNGLLFTDRASAKKRITIKDMGTIPSNAYQYCLSKNKFNEDADGNHTLDIHWYLPDVHELQNVLAATKTDNASVDFGANANYWSSQPAFTGTTYIDENDQEARAVSTQGITSVSRNTQNRIRCFYSRNGIAGVDMKDRVPDGLGGNYSFVMKGDPSDGYFHNLLTGKTVNSPESIVEDFADDWYPYPSPDYTQGDEFPYLTIVDSGNITRGGFERNPADVNNWNEYVIDLGLLGDYATGYYTTLDTYPGLIEYTTEKIGRSILDIGLDLPILGHVSLLRAAEYLNVDVDQWLLINAYKPTTTRLTQTQKLTTSSIIDLTNEPLPAASDLRPLDHANNKRLKISFSGANTEGYSPDFEYYKLVNKTNASNTRFWVPPAYTPETFTISSTPRSETGQGTGSSNNWNTTTNKNTARQDAFNRAYSEAKENALDDLTDKIDALNTTDPGWTITGSVSYTELAWNTIPESSYSAESQFIFWTTTCTVTVTASATIQKPGSRTLYKLVSGTGQWGTPVPDPSTHEGPTLTYDELRIYSGNSFTISCTDPDYEITKVRVYLSGSNQIEDDDTSTDYFARFVDAEINLDTPIAGDESSHLFGMEYNDADGWHQWSGSGEQSVTLNLADYVLTANIDLGNMTWEDFISGNWETAVTYDYEYQKASKALSKYIVVDRIEVKCTKKATAATE